jgi:hypothetical protein
MLASANKQMPNHVLKVSIKIIIFEMRVINPIRYFQILLKKIHD